MSIQKRRKVDGFLNVDLDLVAKADLSPLLECFGESVFVLRNTVERRVHTLWLEHSPEPRHIDQAIMQYAALVRRLPRPGRKLWSECRSRCLNIGLEVEAAQAPSLQSFELSAEAVFFAAQLHAEIVITVYSRALTDRESTSRRKRSR